MSNKYQVSIVIPTYNCDRYISQAIESVLNQTDCDSEIIVIDDGSTDQTKAILSQYGNQIKYIWQRNQGVSIARNHGLKIAQADLILFLDADDYLIPGKLSKQIALFNFQPNLGIVHSGWQKVDATGKAIINICLWEKIPLLNLETWLQWKPILPSAMMFRREWLIKVGGFDSRFPPAEDVDLVLRLALKGCAAVWLKEITVCYRQHEASAMSRGIPQAESLTAVLDNFFQQPNLPTSVEILARKVRYGTFVWLGWYLYHTGHEEAMKQYLQKSWIYSPYSPVPTIINWIESFQLFAAEFGVNFNIQHLCRLGAWQEVTQWLVQGEKKS
ncbi:MAG: glycosyltransferase [Cyanobacteria bacterium J083]|nr:MAG: glycosyltransferase [Cyanobacteria bacterium J083]